MLRARFSLVSSFALLTILACGLPAGSTEQAPTAQIIEVTATPVIRPAEAQATAVPTAEALMVTTIPSGDEMPSPPATLPPNCFLDSDFVTDVTIPDLTPIKANSVFVKTWRLRNSGTCPWSGGFKFVQISGGMLTSTPSTIPLPEVLPGGEIDISMTLTLSSAAPVGSRQTARFQIQAPDGRLFGTKPFVKIVVVQSTE